MGRLPRVLLFSDDIRAPTGVGNMCRTFVEDTMNCFEWIHIAVSRGSSDAGKRYKLHFPGGEVTMYTCDGFCQPELLSHVVGRERPEALVLMQDPAVWSWLFGNLDGFDLPPIIFYTVWDNLPDPVFNRELYRACARILCISRLTFGIVSRLLPEPRQPDIRYVPHCGDPAIFSVIPPRSPDEQLLRGVRERYFKNAQFKVFVNSVNQMRKRLPDIIMGFNSFSETHPEIDCALVIHAKTRSGDAADLIGVVQLCQPGTRDRITINETGLSIKELNLFYNAADVTVNISSEEGFGLSALESMLAGTPIIVNVTGGLQDQCSFAFQDGSEIDQHTYIVEKSIGWMPRTSLRWGAWAFPVWPVTRSLIGCPSTPYLFQDIVGSSALCQVLDECSKVGSEELRERGLKGREFALLHFDKDLMVDRIREAIESVIEIDGTRELRER